MGIRSLVVCAVAAQNVSCGPPLVVPDATRAAAMIQETCAAGGLEEPSAAYYLSLAKRELARARVLSRAGDVEGAHSWARRAAADADVARMLAVEATLRGAARRTEDDAEALSRELEMLR